MWLYTGIFSGCFIITQVIAILHQRQGYFAGFHRDTIESNKTTEQRSNLLRKDMMFLDMGYVDKYRQVPNISRTSAGNKFVDQFVDHSDVVGASPVGAAPTASSISTEYLASIAWANRTARRGEEHLRLVIWCTLY